jgi:hypothetical protein
MRAMITGRKVGEAAQGIGRSHAWLGLLLLALVAAFAVWYPTTQAGAPAERAAQVEKGEKG